MQTTEAEVSSAPDAKRKPGRPAKEAAPAVSNFPPTGVDPISRMGRRISERAKHLNCEVCGGVRWAVMSDSSGAIPVLPSTEWQLSNPVVAYVCTDCCFVRLFSVRWLEKLEQTADHQERYLAAAAARRNS